MCTWMFIIPNPRLSQGLQHKMEGRFLKHILAGVDGSTDIKLHADKNSPTAASSAGAPPSRGQKSLSVLGQDNEAQKRWGSNPNSTTHGSEARKTETGSQEELT